MKKRKLLLGLGIAATLLAAWLFALFTGRLPGPDAKKAEGLQAEVARTLPPGSTLAQVKTVLDRRGITYTYYQKGDPLFLSGYDGSDWQGIPKEQIGGYTDSSLETKAGGVLGGERVFLFFVFDPNGKLILSRWNAFRPGF